jgi:hypothetical protein
MEPFALAPCAYHRGNWASVFQYRQPPPVFAPPARYWYE